MGNCVCSPRFLGQEKEGWVFSLPHCPYCSGCRAPSRSGSCRTSARSCLWPFSGPWCRAMGIDQGTKAGLLVIFGKGRFQIHFETFANNFVVVQQSLHFQYWISGGTGWRGEQISRAIGMQIQNQLEKGDKNTFIQTNHIQMQSLVSQNLGTWELRISQAWHNAGWPRNSLRSANALFKRPGVNSIVWCGYYGRCSSSSKVPCYNWICKHFYWYWDRRPDGSDTGRQGRNEMSCLVGRSKLKSVLWWWCSCRDEDPTYRRTRNCTQNTNQIVGSWLTRWRTRVWKEQPRNS